MSTQEVANAFTALCKQGKFDEAGKEFWSDSVVSLEAMQGEGARAEGRKAVEAKGEWWYANHEVHSAKTEGPYVHGDQFIVRFTLDLTPKGGARMTMDEMGQYTVADGKIVEERFFYGG
ncbi:MAG: nuclear transport factor 2 family protein [Ramlibacter sp.]